MKNTMTYIAKKANEIAEIINDLNKNYPLSDGQECKIYKSTKSWDDMDNDEIIYITDVCINDILHLWYEPFEATLADIINLAECSYTKADFIDLAGDKAEELFCYVDWQHPSSAWDAGELDD